MSLAEMDMPVAMELESSRLLSLPLELREMIWRYVLVEPEPIFTCLVQHAVTRPRCHSKRARMRSFWHEIYSRTPSVTTTKLSLWPRLPILSRVNTQLRREALEVFFRDNVFLFRLDYQMSDRDVERWQETLLSQWSRSMLPAGLFRLWTIRLEFMVQSQTGGMRQPTILDCSLGPNGDLAHRFQGALKQECTCRYQDNVRSLTKEATASTAGQNELIAKVAALVEEQIKAEWGRRGRWMTLPYLCVRCGLARTEQRTAEELKRYSDRCLTGLVGSKPIESVGRSGGRLIV
ncbi:hypothetical protein LTR62_001738 [Meristemomyces frigidus]|uniref:2EXR domain-containing protein n=1 Tax=Meristemomyces frigidus TaxID=1508187 RepID=A0AAN7YQF2_9PEZI|nr:hypothetical protein LTR62_001738 [Meristemomyces frigidus]